MAQSGGNGIDIGAVYQLLVDMSGRMDGMSARMEGMSARMDGMSTRLDGVEGKLGEVVATVNEHSRRFDEIADVLNAHSRRLDDLSDGLTDLRAAVTNYHNTVIGHGIRLTDLDDRVRRIERHLKLEAGDD
ncbi:MAG: hypothetical protein JO032_11715 [Alphaproteobacteria bacterium]|nr:hypothetical protein [Alphaproteobacteria bacterium]